MNTVASRGLRPCKSAVVADLSLNADVTVAAWGRARLERLLCYCVRPVFASERLQWIQTDQRLVYRPPPYNFTGSEIGQRYAGPERTDPREVVRSAPLRPAMAAYAGLPARK